VTQTETKCGVWNNTSRASDFPKTIMKSIQQAGQPLLSTAVGNSASPCLELRASLQAFCKTCSITGLECPSENENSVFRSYECARKMLSLQVHDICHGICGLWLCSPAGDRRHSRIRTEYRGRGITCPPKNRPHIKPVVNSMLGIVTPCS